MVNLEQWRIILDSLFNLSLSKRCVRLEVVRSERRSDVVLSLVHLHMIARRCFLHLTQGPPACTLLLDAQNMLRRH